MKKEDKRVLNKSLDQSFYKRAFSPAPIPRQKILIRVLPNNKNNIPYGLNQTILSEDKVSIDNNTNTTLISDSTLSTNLLYPFSSTLPTPRKPRKKTLDCKRNLDIQSGKKIALNETKNYPLLPYSDATNYLSNFIYGFENIVSMDVNELHDQKSSKTLDSSKRRIG
jgi:hypothetical protein